MLEPSQSHLEAIPKEALVRLRALAPEDLILRFQPILLIRDPGQIALELLVRFRPKELASHGTAAVVQWLNGLDLMHRLDDLVLQRLGQVRQSWRELGGLAERINYISVNISAGSIASPARLNALIARLRAQRVDSSRFCLELSETPAMAAAPGVDDIPAVSARLMDELKMRLMVDDFGSGMSNYRRLCEAKYDAIKLDVELVRGISASLQLQSFVGSLVEAVHGLGKTVIAEGVEGFRDFETLLRLGIDGVQGFLIAPALPWREVSVFLHDSPWVHSDYLPALRAKIRSNDRRMASPLLSSPEDELQLGRIPLERYVLHHWSSLNSFEEVVLLYLQELRGWGLQVLRFSLAFLPNQEEVDCSQYIWYASRPGEVRGQRMKRDFLETAQHRKSVLHHIATRERFFRLLLLDQVSPGFEFLEELRELGGSDYLGLRLPCRGVSTPVLSVCLCDEQRFTPDQIERLEALSALLSLLFHAFECERASRLALLDELTQLPNRRSFDSRIRAEIVAAKTIESPLAIILIDVDRFKLVNDRLGHAYGDTCLSELAAVLQQNLLREGDMVARLGGEEFGVVLAHTGSKAAFEIAEKLRKAVADAMIHHPAPVNGLGVTISMGLVSWTPREGAELDLDHLLQQADDCLYSAKNSGRNRLVAAELLM